MDYPNPISSIKSEEDCFWFLFYRRWPRHYRCPGCAGQYYSIRRSRWTVRCGRCQKETSLTAGTGISRSHISPLDWLRVVWLASSTRGPLSPDMLIKAGLIHRYATAWLLTRRIWAWMKAAECSPLSGDVQVHRTNVVVRTEPSGEKTIVSIAGAVEIGVVDVLELCPEENKQVAWVVGQALPPSLDRKGRTKLAVMPSFDMGNLVPFANTNVAMDSRIQMKSHSIFQELKTLGYTVDMDVRDPENPHDPILKIIRGEFGYFENWLGKSKRKVKVARIPEYMDEFIFRRNSDFSSFRSFNRLLAVVVGVETTDTPQRLGADNHS